MARFFGFFLPLFLSLTLSACGALNNIYWTQGVNDKDGKVFTVDAKQRHLLLNPNIFDAPVELKNGIYYVQNQGRTVSGYGSAGHGGGTPHVRWRMCAEAAPDVFAAVNSSIAASGALNAKEKAQFAVSIAESAATIERTQTVNLLRESMYRTCERWLSGAIDQETFIIQAARDQRSMVAVLAIEQLTGAIKAKSTIIGGPETEASISDADEIVELMKTYQAERKAAQDVFDAAEADYNKKFDVGGEQKILCKLPEKPEGDAVSDEVKDAYDLCTGKKIKRDAAESDLAAAKQKEKILVEQASKLTSGVGSSTGTIYNQSGGFDGQPQFTGEQLAKVADVVGRIAMQPNLDEGLMFCIAYLGRSKYDQIAGVSDGCIDLLKQRDFDDKQLREKLFGITPEQRRQGTNDRGGYYRFKNDFYTFLGKVDRKKLTSNFKKFQTATKTGLDYSSHCKTVYSCQRYLDKNDIFKSKWLDNANEIQSAFEAWKKLENL